MKLIVGLGNPGTEYKNTRHNVGFMILDKYALDNGLSFDKKKFNASYVETVIGEEKVIFLKPMEYMNLSGQSVLKFAKFFKIDYNDILIVHDDLDIDFGKYKLKASGNDGGNNGVKNIINMLNSNNIKRLKIGIGNNKSEVTKNYVLSSFNEEEKKVIIEISEIAVKIIADFIKTDFVLLMNKYN